MANRYWVGGTGDWSDNTNHWAATSGGAPGASVPSSSDDVFLNASSGLAAATISLDVAANAKSFTSTTGATYSIGGANSLSIYGSFTGEAGLTISRSVFFLATTSVTINQGGGTFTGSLNFNGIGGTWTAQSHISTTGEFFQDAGTFDANDFNITAAFIDFFADTGSTPTVTMGSGTWTATGSGSASAEWSVTEANGALVTINPETSTIKIFDTYEGYFYQATTQNGRTYGVRNITYNNVWFAKGGANFINVSGSFTANELKIDPGIRLLVDDAVGDYVSDTITLSSLVAAGTAALPITLNTFDGTGQFNISSPTGMITGTHLLISNSNATGGATWYANASSDVTNNSGWIFPNYAPVPEVSVERSPTPTVSVINPKIEITI